MHKSTSKDWENQKTREVEKIGINLVKGRKKKIRRKQKRKREAIAKLERGE